MKTTCIAINRTQAYIMMIDDGGATRMLSSLETTEFLQFSYGSLEPDLQRLVKAVWNDALSKHDKAKESGGTQHLQN